MNRKERGKKTREPIRHNVMSRRRFLIISGLGAGSLIATRLGCGILSPQKEMSSDGEVIQAEAERMGIKFSEQEGLLWQKGHPKSPEKLPVNEKTIQEAIKRTETTLRLMKQSENSYLRDAIAYLESFGSKGPISITLVEKPAEGQEDSAMGIAFQIKDENFHIRLEINIEEVLNNSSSATLALQITHEIEHIKNAMKFQESLPQTLTPQERLEKEQERSNNPEEFLNEEARGYAVESKAYIYHYGLGYRGKINQEKGSAQFVRCGSDEKSACWRNYVKTEILEKKRLTPN